MNADRAARAQTHGESAGWQPMDSAPKDQRLLACVEGEVRVIRWGKTSHVPMYGFCLADQGAEDFDLCKPDCWMPLPAAPGATS